MTSAAYPQVSPTQFYHTEIDLRGVWVEVEIEYSCNPSAVLLDVHVTRYSNSKLSIKWVQDKGGWFVDLDRIFFLYVKHHWRRFEREILDWICSRNSAIRVTNRRN